MLYFQISINKLWLLLFLNFANSKAILLIISHDSSELGHEGSLRTTVANALKNIQGTVYNNSIRFPWPTIAWDDTLILEDHMPTLECAILQIVLTIIVDPEIEGLIGDWSELLHPSPEDEYVTVVDLTGTTPTRNVQVRTQICIVRRISEIIKHFPFVLLYDVAFNDVVHDMASYPTAELVDESIREQGYCTLSCCVVGRTDRSPLVFTYVVFFAMIYILKWIVPPANRIDKSIMVATGGHIPFYFHRAKLNCIVYRRIIISILMFAFFFNLVLIFLSPLDLIHVFEFRAFDRMCSTKHENSAVG